MALRQILKAHGISQSKLASALEVERPIVFRWFHEQTDPTAETVFRIVETLRGLQPRAADEFIRLYLGGPSQVQTNEIEAVLGQHLPLSEQVNVSALACLFGETTNSYKYLFFLSLLDILKRRHFEVLSPISFQELIVEMLANAWFPHTFFKLSFGSQDKIAQKLDSLDLVIEEPIIRFRDADKKMLRKAIASQNLKDVLLHLRRYVPFRLIIPFVETELDNVSRSKGNQLDIAMPEIVDRCFETHKPLYRFDSAEYKNCQSILVHPDWASYLEQHYGIVRDWAAWNWLNYMQKRNPSTPAISSKLFTPTKRDSLDKQTKYWKLVLQDQRLHCIYSNQSINPDRFSLDHYLPWSFVAHDQLWNLVPTLPEVNSAKSNKLPSSKYLEDFTKIQHSGLIASRSLYSSEAKWLKTVEPYIADLNISEASELIDFQALLRAYRRTIEPLEALARNQGFSENWSYRTAG